MKYIDGLVSIITPVYNSSKYIGKMLDSVCSQIYQNWELIIVDDCSTDDTVSVIEKYQQKDIRIKLCKLAVNQGPANARNLAIKKAEGRYVAFLDSDDYWTSDKLSKQIEFMQKNSYAVSWHDYWYIKTNENNRLIHVKTPDSLNYEGLLKGNSTGSSLTICIDRNVVDNIYMPNQKHEDYICWLNILKEYHLTGYGLHESLGYYRIGKPSVSNNKIKSVFWTWKVYRDSQGLSLIKSIYCMIYYITKALLKRGR